MNFLMSYVRSMRSRYEHMSRHTLILYEAVFVLSHTQYLVGMGDIDILVRDYYKASISPLARLLI